MNKYRRRLVTALAAALAPAPILVRAQPSGENPGYTTLTKELPVEGRGKIEVAEFFWYGCIHCYNLEPLLEIGRAHV